MRVRRAIIRLFGVSAVMVTLASMSVNSFLATPAGASPVTCGTNGVFNAAANSCTYTTTGTDSYTVPAGAEQVTILVDGAQGGSGEFNAGGGLGGQALATIGATPGEVLQLTVGTAGNNTVAAGGGGGGASDIRSGSCTSGLTCTLADRIIVAGGGGGGGACSGVTEGTPACRAGGGGAGSGANGNSGASVSGCGTNGGGGGTQNQGGPGGTGQTNQLGPLNGANGSLGSGGQGGGFGGQSGNATPGGSGGDGYYGGGGGGGGSGSSSCDAAGGGGGSGFITASAIVNTTATGVRSGNGQIVITALSGTATATSITSSVNPSLADQPVTYTATVTPVPDGGTVQFSDTGTPLPGCAAQPVNTTTGTATCAITYVAAQSHTVAAEFVGTSSFLASQGTVTQTVNPVASTTTTLTSAPNPSTVEQSVTYTSTTTPVPDAGTVSFIDGTTTISACSAQPINTTTGRATCAVVYPVSSSHSVSATYAGDTSFPSSTSNTVVQTVNPAPSTTTSLSSNHNPSAVGLATTYTATVAPIPDAGTVEFIDGGTSDVTGCAAQPVSSTTGKATCTITYSTSGTHSITATYGGDSNYPTSTSPALTETVNPRTATISLSSSANPSALTQKVTYTATVTPVAPSVTQPTGTVEFIDGSSDVSGCAAQPVNVTTGQATCAITYNTAGTHSITAAYSGDTAYPSVTSTMVSQTVNNTGPTYTQPGTYLFTVLPGVTRVTFDVFGAQGGSGEFNAGGGSGGEATATLSVTPGQTYEVTVGTAGNNTVAAGGGGGGASDIRSGSCTSGLTCTLADRIIVAGGGGGGGACSGVTEGTPACRAGGGGAGSGANGNGGTSVSGCGTNGGGGGTQNQGGPGGTGQTNQIGPLNGADGSLGTGGQGGGFGGQSGNATPGGSGGDGYYGGGGGGGGSGSSSCDAAGGGGGSGFITASVLSSNTATGVQSGNGKVVITMSSAPTASITSPTTSGPYVVGQSVPTAFTCSPGMYGPAVSTCADGAGHSSPSALNTSATGNFTYTVTATSADGQTGTASLDYTVDQTPTITFSTPPAHPEVNGTYQVNATADSGATVALSIAPGNQTICSLQNDTVTFLHVGSCAINADVPATGFYTEGTATQDFTVYPAPITVTVSGSQTYGTSNPAFTGTATPPNPGPTVTTTNLTCSTVDTNVAISPTLSAGSHTVVPTSCSGATLSGTNQADYVIVYAGTTNDFTVNQAPITVTVSGSQTYGTSNPAFTGVDTPPNPGPTVTTTNLTCSTVDTNVAISPTLNAGSHTLVPTSCSGATLSGTNQADYVIVYAGTTNDFTVNQAPITVTVSGSQTYGTSNPAFTGTDTPPNPGPTVTTTNLTCSTVDTNVAISPTLSAGSHTLVPTSCSGATLSGTNQADYVIVYAGTTNDFTVNQAPITVTVSGTQGFNSSNPTFSGAETLPNGITLSGTPTCHTVNNGTTISASLQPGQYTIDGSSCSGLTPSDAQDYVVVYVGATNGFVVTPIAVAPSSIPNGANGVLYLQTFTASGGTGPYTFTLGSGSLPPGLTLSSTGVLRGTPTVAGTYTFTIIATQPGGGFGQGNYTIVVVPAIAPAPTGSAVLLPGCHAFSQTYTTGLQGSQFSVVSGSLPPGLTLSPNGVLSGTPTTYGTYSFTIQATTPGSPTLQRLYMFTSGLCIDGGNPTLPAAVHGTNYSFTLSASGGTAPYRFELQSGGAAGLSLSLNGLISGRPSSPGTYTFNVIVIDSSQAQKEGTLTLTLTVS